MIITAMKEERERRRAAGEELPRPVKRKERVPKREAQRDNEEDKKEIDLNQEDTQET